jgi:hypothetical protein
MLHLYRRNRKDARSQTRCLPYTYSFYPPNTNRQNKLSGYVQVIETLFTIYNERPSTRERELDIDLWKGKNHRAMQANLSAQCCMSRHL